MTKLTDEVVFWEILQLANLDNTPYSVDKHVNQLERELSELADDDLLEFHQWFHEKLQQARTWEMWAAAWITPDQNNAQGCGDDEFDDFCAGLVARGRTTFESVVKEPDLVAEISNPELLKSGEGFINAADRIYAKRHGQGSSIYYVLNTPLTVEPTGECWKETDRQYFVRKLPCALQKFGFPS